MVRAHSPAPFASRTYHVLDVSAVHRLRGGRAALDVTVGRMEPTPSENAHIAVDDLLTVVATAADDLTTFHAALSQARIAQLPPYPRATVMLTVRIIDHLKTVEQELRDVMTALGLSKSPRS